MNENTPAVEQPIEVTPRERAIDLLLRRTSLARTEAEQLLRDHSDSEIDSLLKFEKHPESSRLLARVVDEFLGKRQAALKPKPPEPKAEEPPRRKRPKG